MLIAGEISRSFPETIFGRSLPQGSSFMPNIEQKIRPNNSQSDSQKENAQNQKYVILEIILRDYLGAILRVRAKDWGG
jgi:hypothetical protein